MFIKAEITVKEKVIYNPTPLKLFIMTNYYVDGKQVKNKKSIPKEAVLKRVVDECYYETPQYSREQSVKTMNYFNKLQEDREELERRHG